MTRFILYFRTTYRTLCRGWNVGWFTWWKRRFFVGRWTPYAQYYFLAIACQAKPWYKSKCCYKYNGYKCYNFGYCKARIWNWNCYCQRWTRDDASNEELQLSVSIEEIDLLYSLICSFCSLLTCSLAYDFLLGYVCLSTSCSDVSYPDNGLVYDGRSLLPILLGSNSTPLFGPHDEVQMRSCQLTWTTL